MVPSSIFKNILDESDQDSGNFVLPTEYYHGIYLISKVVLTDKEVLFTITNTFTKAPRGSYVLESLDLTDSGVSFVVYIPQTLSNNLGPVVISITEDKVIDTIPKCANLHAKYHIYHICLIITAQRIVESLFAKISIYQELPILTETLCNFWADKCFLVSSTDIENNMDQLKGHPLLDIVITFGSNKKVVFHDKT